MESFHLLFSEAMENKKSDATWKVAIEGEKKRWFVKRSGCMWKETMECEKNRWIWKEAMEGFHFSFSKAMEYEKTRWKGKVVMEGEK